MVWSTLHVAFSQYQSELLDVFAGLKWACPEGEALCLCVSSDLPRGLLQAPQFSLAKVPSRAPCG